MSIKTHSILVLLLIFGGMAWVIASGGAAIPMLFVVAGFFAAIALGFRAVIGTFTKR